MRIVPAVFLLLTTCQAYAAKTLDIYFIDVEGGKATLIVPPSGQAFLIDTGYNGNAGRDALRIYKAAKEAGVKRLDTLLLSHFHDDHTGGVKNLLEKLPVANFLDHGVSVDTNAYPKDYAAALATGQHKVVAAGDKIAIKGLDITILTSNGKNLASKPVANAHCAGVAQKPADDPGNAGENPQSIAVLIQFGKFRFADLGDLPWNRELSLVCPENLIGPVDVYETAHHGAESPQGIYGLAPRVAIMDNGAKKGGNPEAWKRISQSPGLEDMWQLHFSIAGGSDANVSDTRIANLHEQCEGVHLKLSAMEDGSFTITNPRNRFTKAYKPR